MLEYWWDANYACQAVGMSLVKVNSKVKQDYLVTLLNTNHKR